MVAEPSILYEGHAPTPFTAEQIRRGCPQGRTVTTLTETADGATETHISRFLDCDAEGATYVTGDGERRVTWIELQAHASFPADATSISRETIETSLGRLRCLRYEVAEGAQRRVFWFDETRPGMPVLFTVEGDGGVLTRSTVVADEIVPVAEV